MKADRVVSFSLAAAVMVLAWLSPRFLPYSMDEFVHYHALGCALHPLEREYVFAREGCGSYDLTLPLTRTPLPLRSYHYIGSLPSWVFYPFWRLVRDPVAARLQGALFLVACAGLFCALEGVSFASALAGFLALPVLLFSFLVDLGPVGLSLLLLEAALFLWKGALRAAAAPGRLASAALAGLCVFLGLWVKLVFVWPLAGGAFLAWWWAREVRGEPSRPGAVAQALGGFLVAAAVPTTFLLLAKDARGASYYAAAARGKSAFESLSPQTVLHLGRYIVDGAAVVPLTLRLPPSPLDALPFVLCLALLGLAWRGRRRWLPWLCAFALTFGVTALTRGAAWPHHVSLALFFLLAAVGLAIESLGGRMPLALGSALGLGALFWVSLAVRWPSATVNPEANAAKDVLVRFVHEQGLDRTTVEAHSSWGTFYLSHLLGDSQQIALETPGLPDRSGDLEAVRALADETGRGVLLITARPPARFRTAEVAHVLGPPLETRSFENWWAVRYVR